MFIPAIDKPYISPVIDVVARAKKKGTKTKTQKFDDEISDGKAIKFAEKAISMSAYMSVYVSVWLSLYSVCTNVTVHMYCTYVCPYVCESGENNANVSSAPRGILQIEKEMETRVFPVHISRKPDIFFY